eukprot:7723838-Alexandrium_andersonii.AAC.1
MHDPPGNDPLASAKVLKLEHRPIGPLTHRMDRAVLLQVGSVEGVTTELGARLARTTETYMLLSLATKL